MTRVFCREATEITPVDIAELLHAAGLPVVPHFRGDDLGWTAGTLTLPGPGSPIDLERFLTKEDELRPQLNAFAGELETMDYSPNNVPLMQHVIQTQQLVAIRRPLDHPNDAQLDTLAVTLARHLAATCDGVYQIDGEGWFAADGTELLAEH
jgi:hypothetical protein